MAAENVACGVRRHWEGSSQYRSLSRACTDAASAGIMNLSIKEDAVKVHRRLRRLTNDTDNRAAGYYEMGDISRRRLLIQTCRGRCAGTSTDSIKRIACGEAKAPAAYIAVGHWNSVGTAQFAEVKKIRCETPLPPYASGTIRYRRS